MGRQDAIKAFGFAALAWSALLSCSAALAVEPEPPGWWYNHNKGTLELIYERGASGKCPTEEAARQKAHDAGLATLRKRITSDTNLWPRIQFAGSDIAFESIQQDSRGKWHAWVLVSYPRALFETALQRAEELANATRERTTVFVPEVAFGNKSEEQFPEVVEKFRKLGYGNGIWLTMEDLLYEEGYEIVTVPRSQAKSMLEQIFGLSVVPASQTVKLPDAVVVCNMNFFTNETSSISWGREIRNSVYHAELLLEWSDVAATYGNVKIPAKGEAIDKDLLVATQQAAERAISNLVERLRAQ